MFKNNYTLFPLNPVDGDTTIHNQRTYTYYAPKNTWYGTGINPDDIITQDISQDPVDPNDTLRGEVVSYHADILIDEQWLHARQRQIADLQLAQEFIRIVQEQLAANETPAVPLSDLETFIEDMTWCFVDIHHPSDVQFPKRPWD